MIVFKEAEKNPDEEKSSVEQVVRDILSAVRAGGDAAVLDYTERFDGYRPASLRVSPDAVKAAYSKVEPETVANLKFAADRIRGFWPWPGASSHYLNAEAGKTVRVTLALADVIWGPVGTGSVPGTFDEDLNVICQDGKLSIRKIKPAGSGLMEFRDFINGWRVRPGDRFIEAEV